MRDQFRTDGITTDEFKQAGAKRRDRYLYTYI